MPGIKRLNRRTILRHLAVWLLAAALAAPAFAGPRSIVRSGRTSVSNSVIHSLLDASGGSARKALSVVGDDSHALNGFYRMARMMTRANPGDKDKIIVALGRTISKLEGDVGEAEVRRLLRNFRHLEDWAGTNARRVEAVQDILADMSRRGRGRYLGGWYELSLAIDLVGPPSVIRQLQPKKGNDVKLFRDFLVRIGGIETYIEAKNWRRTPVTSGAKRLRAQVKSHFRRLRHPPPEQVLNIPPGRKLQFLFNAHESMIPPSPPTDIPASWKQSIRHQTYHTLISRPPAGYGLSKKNAKTWVANNLDIQVRPAWPPSP